MKELHVKIADETDQQVQAVLGQRSLDEFTDEALRREALRHESGRKLNDAIKEGRASGLTGGTLDELTTAMRAGVKSTTTEHPAA